MRIADTVGDLERTPWIEVATTPGVTPPVDLDAVLRAAGIDVTREGHVVMLEVTLQSLDHLNRPVLDSLAISYSCALIFD